MEEIAYMLCMRVDELDEPVEGSTTTACVECGDDIWISAESRKEMSKLKAMPCCSRCAERVMKEHPSEVREVNGPTPGQWEEIAREIGEEEAAAFQLLMEDEDTDTFEALKATASMSGTFMKNPGDDWGSMAVMENFDGFTYPPIPLSEMMENGVPKDVIAKRLLPAMAQASEAKRVLFGISTWTLKGEKNAPLPEGSIADHPDREEALVLIDVTADGVQQMSIAEIIRDGVHGPRLGEWHDSDKPEASTGLFVDALIPVLQLVRTLRS